MTLYCCTTVIQYSIAQTTWWRVATGRSLTGLGQSRPTASELAPHRTLLAAQPMSLYLATTGDAADDAAAEHTAQQRQWALADVFQDCGVDVVDESERQPTDDWAFQGSFCSICHLYCQAAANESVRSHTCHSPLPLSHVHVTPRRVHACITSPSCPIFRLF